VTPLERRVLRLRQAVIREFGIQGRTGRALHVWRGQPLIYGAKMYLGPGGQIDVRSNTWVVNCHIIGRAAPGPAAAIRYDAGP